MLLENESSAAATAAGAVINESKQLLQDGKDIKSVSIQGNTSRSSCNNSRSGSSSSSSRSNSSCSFCRLM